MFALYSSNGCQLHLFFAFFVNKKESLQFLKICYFILVLCSTDFTGIQKSVTMTDKLELTQMVFTILVIEIGN